MFFIGPIIFKNNYSKLYSIIASILLLFVVVFQNISNNTSHGFAILIGNIITQIVIVLFFLLEIKTWKNNFTKINVGYINIVTLFLHLLLFGCLIMTGRYILI
jgi:hypothetical protein